MEDEKINDGSLLWAVSVVLTTTLLAIAIATGRADLSWWAILIPVLFMPALYAAVFIVLAAVGLPVLLLMWIATWFEQVFDKVK